MSLVRPGVCRHCGCCEEEPCSLCMAHHGGCSFTNRQQLVCVGDPCVRAERMRVERNAELGRQWRSEGLTRAGLRKKGRAA